MNTSILAAILTESCRDYMAAQNSTMSTSNFEECTRDDQRDRDEERYIRHIDDGCWISALHRMTGFGYMQWETALVFVAPGSTERECLIIRGDRRAELNDTPKDKLREWYAANIDGNRNSMETIIHAMKQTAISP